LVEWRRRYAAGVHAVDRRLKRFFERLRTTGLLDRTVIVLTSDHGEELFEHGGWNHGRNLYDQQLHVPLMIRYPREGLRGVRVSRIVDLGDLMITLLGIAGAPIPESVGGVDLTPGEMNRDARGEEGMALAAGIGRRPNLHSIRVGRHKLIADIASGDLELYDMVADPGETSDLSEISKDVVARLVLRLQTELERISAAAPDSGKTVEMSEEIVDRLRALGYVD
jgi:arylsulfatase A-like enzyme